MFGLNKKYYIKPGTQDIVNKNYVTNNFMSDSLIAHIGNADGIPVNIDLNDAPHVLIGGATKSGKSVCINAMITSLLFKNSPNDLELYIIDPKKVDYIKYQYSNIPHLKGYADDIQTAWEILNNLHNIMMQRFDIMRSERIDDIRKARKKHPQILCIFDEFASLMNKQGKKSLIPVLEDLLRLGRAAGVHFVLATQRPTADVISGQIKANCPVRIAFKVSGENNSRVILDRNGAAKLKGRGDGLVLTAEGDFIRFQGSWLDADRDNMLNWWGCQPLNKKAYNKLMSA